MEYLTKAEAQEILQDMDISDPEPEKVKPEAVITRLEKGELPDEVQKEVSQCRMGTWYVIEHGEYQYIYYQNLPNDYAFEPVIHDQKADIKIADMKRTGSYDVLLAVKQNMTLTIHYHDRKIKYERVSA